MNYWLIKSEPSVYSWDDLKKDKKTIWSGVRNYQARNFMKEMKKGDLVLFYHSEGASRIEGIAEVAKEHFQDPTSPDDDRWVAFEVKAVKALPKPVTLSQVKAQKSLSELLLVRNSRISVSNVPEKAYQEILAMGGL